MPSLDIEDLKLEYVCSECIGEAYLSAAAVESGSFQKCRSCGEVGPSFSLQDLSLNVEFAFDEHYCRTPDGPDAFEYSMQKDPDFQYQWYREGDPTELAIQEALGVTSEIASDVQRILEDRFGDRHADEVGEETEFASDAHYERIMPDDQAWQESWSNFERSIKTEARFFSRVATGQLSKLFDEIDGMRTSSGESLFATAGPGSNLTHLFRARVFQSSISLKGALIRPDIELSAPPSKVAAAGRMNARGISVFYGATDVDVALAEVRPPVGSQVALARFEIMRPLNLLNLPRLSDLHEDGSIFDPQYADRLSRMVFLQKLGARMARPVMPDSNDFEYLPTQAIADFLATEGKVPLDGIIFPSVQAGVDDLGYEVDERGSVGLNVVLFHKASRCAHLEFPEGTEFDAHTAQQDEDGWRRDYFVVEEVPETEGLETDQGGDANEIPVSLESRSPDVSWDDGDFREITLQVDPSSMEIHVIRAVKFEAEKHSVRRSRWTKSDGDF